MMMIMIMIMNMIAIIIMITIMNETCPFVSTDRKDEK